MKLWGPTGTLSLCIGISITLASCSRAPERLVLGHAVELPGPIMSSVIADVLNEAGFAVEVAAGFESVEELTAAVEGKAVDIALLEEPLRPNQNLRMLLPVYPSVLHAFVREESAPEPARSAAVPSLQALLNAERIYPGPPGGLGARLAAALAGHFNTGDISSALLDSPWAPSPPDAYLVFGDLLSVEAQLGFQSYQMLSFTPSSSTSAEALALLYPNLRPFTLPAGIYPDLTKEPVETLAVETLLVARPDLDSELAYNVIQTLRERPQPLEQAYSLSRASFQNAIDHSIHTIALHAGARRYIDKDAPSFLERYAEVLALVATLTLAAGTMLTTWLRQRRQRRKDRLDEYFVRLQQLRSQIRDSAAAGSSDSNRVDATAVNAQISSDVTQLEGEVLQLLVEERLAVDASLVSFFWSVKVCADRWSR